MEKRRYTIRLTEPMLGTTPKDKEVYKTYIESKKPVGIDEDEADTVEEIEEKGWTGFHSSPEIGLFLYDYMIRGFLKTAALNFKEQFGIKAAKSRIDNFVFVFPRRIPLGHKAPTGVLERPLRAQTAQGPRVTLARSDMVPEGTEITFEVRVLPCKDVTMAKIDEMLEYGQYQGLGQFRNGSYGRFEVVKREDLS